ncbi:ethionine resistance protein, partial [Coemansia sp. Benny D160-2]
TENSELGLSFSIPDANDAFVKYDSVSTAEIAKQEAGVLLKASIQVALAFLLQYSFSFVNVMSLGHLGATELAAAALANMTVYMVVNAPACGLASALETFCSTSFTGSRDKTLVGFHLQRGIISVTIHFILTLPVLINIEPIFIYLRQDPQIAHLCGRFIRAQLPGMLPWIYFECIRCFLQAQRHMNASTYAMGVALPLHLVSTYFLVWSQRFGIGFIGAAVANVGTFWATFLGIVVYCRYTDVRAAWGGWTRRAFVTMPEYYRLALPSIVMVCSDWIGWELMAITASYLGNTTLAAQSIAINTCPITYQWANGLRTAISNRTGNLLGQTRARRAEISSAVGLCLGAAWGVISMAIYISAASWWGHVYTKDANVISVVSVIMPFCGIFQLGDCMNAV